MAEQMKLLDGSGAGPRRPRSMDSSLDRARERVQRGLREPGGILCPCCGQTCALRKRRINGAMARALIAICSIRARDGDRWVHLRELPNLQARSGGGDFQKLRHWDLIEGMPKATDPLDTNPRSGFWRATPAGMEFVRGDVWVPAYKLMFDAEVYDESEELITIVEAVGTRFDYDEIMSGAFPDGG